MKKQRKQFTNVKIVAMAIIVLVFTTACSSKETEKEDERRCGFFFFEDGKLYYNSEVYFNFLYLKPDYVFEPDRGEIGTYSCGDREGYINICNRGITIPALRFESAWQFDYESGIAAVVVDGKMGFINENGDYLLEPTFPYDNDNYIAEPFGFYEGYCVVPSYQGKAGLINTDFELVVDTVYDWVLPTEYNYYKVFIDETVGMISPDFVQIIPCQYEYIEILDCGIIVNNSMADIMCKLIDFDGKTVLCEHVANEFSDIYYDSNYFEPKTDTAESTRYAAFECDFYVGVVDKLTGRVVIPARWDSVTMLSEEIFIVGEDSYKFLMDNNGNFINR